MTDFSKKNRSFFFAFRKKVLLLHRNRGTPHESSEISLNAKIAQLVEHNLAKVRVAGSSPVFRSLSRESSSVGRARPCQGRGRGFEPRFSLPRKERFEISLNLSFFLFCFGVQERVLVKYNALFVCFVK